MRPMLTSVNTHDMLTNADIMVSMRSLTPKDVGALIRETRLEAGMTQAELAERIGASRYWVAEFERGKPRAELGLALKALKALRLVLTIESRDSALQRQDHDERGASRILVPHQPIVDLSSILTKSTAPSSGFWPQAPTSTPFRAWEQTQPERPSRSQKKTSAPRRRRGQ
jgi:transcriptional regulator with XRE-family HTH domain